MRTGQDVVLTRQIAYPTTDEHDQPITSYLEKGAVGKVAGIIEAGSETMVLFQPEGVEQVFAVSKSAVK